MAADMAADMAAATGAVAEDTGAEEDTEAAIAALPAGMAASRGYCGQ